MSTEIEDVVDHITQAAGKMREAADHLAPVADFLQRVRGNPLVTAFGSVTPGKIGPDTQAVLNGLLPILGALGAKNLEQPPDPTPAPAPSITIGGGGADDS